MSGTRRRSDGLFATLVLAAGLLVGASAAARAETQRPDAARRGALVQLLVQDCGSCHGLTLRGGLGRPLRPEDVADRDVDLLAAVILDGLPGTPMPPWRGLLDEADATFLAEALKKGVVP